MLLDYLPLHPLGNGATGIVFLAAPASASTHTHHLLPPEDGVDDPPSFFAIKAFRRSRDHDLQRARNEQLILSKLLLASTLKPAPFLPRLYSAFDDGEFRFLVLDYCSGGDLNALQHSLPEKRFSSAAIRFYAAEIVLALERLHEEGIVYRDLKPENILLSSDGHIMLTDFDLSVTLPPKKLLPPAAASPMPFRDQHTQQEDAQSDGNDRVDSSTMTCLGCTGGKQRNGLQRRDGVQNRSRHRVVPASSSIGKEDPQSSSSLNSSASADHVRSNSFVGTEEYIAPEVVRGTGHDFAVDWWGLGVLLFEMAHACTPFAGRTTKQTFHNIVHQEPKLIPGAGSTGPLAGLILQLLVKDPARRLGSGSGAMEIKAHPFFAGLQWDTLQDVMRPPFIPLSEPSELGKSGFDLTAHLVQIECARSEARARRRLQRKQAA